MIQFFCKCGHRFNLDDAEAGGTIQCNDCGLLNDIPLHQDLASITEDGTYKLDAPPVLNNPEVAADLIYVYTRGAADVHGYEKDMRLSDQELDLAGSEAPIPLDPQHLPREDVPKYDPETGELIVPMDVKDHHAHPITKQQMPIGPPTLNYATASVGARPSMAMAVVYLFSPPNLAVMFAVFCMHVLLWPLQFVLSAGIFFLVVAEPVMIALIVSHYGNVVEDIGPHQKDDLPRPLRDLDWYDDLWLPFCNVFGSWVICYLPLFFVAALPDDTSAHRMVLICLTVVFSALGTFIFPAVLLTLCGSGTILNMRPDRLLKVIAVTGPAYFFVMVLWMLTAVVYGWGVMATTVGVSRLMDSSPAPHVLLRWPVGIATTLVGIFLMHYLCYCLGLLYRVHHHDFCWVLQSHERTTPMLPQPVPPGRPRRRTNSTQIQR